MGTGVGGEVHGEEDFGMLLPFAGFPLGFPHRVKKRQPFSENPAHRWTVTRVSCNKSIGITWVFGRYSVADVQGNNGDGDGGNQHERSNKGRGSYATTESQWVNKHTWQERSGLGCMEGGTVLLSSCPSAL